MVYVKTTLGTKMFAGKRYRFHKYLHYEDEARAEAKLLRSKGWRVRIVNQGKAWGWHGSQIAVYKYNPTDKRWQKRWR